MRTSLVLGALLVVTATGCSDSDDEDASASSETTAVASASPSSSGSYVDQVNALCEAMIDGVMAVRGDSDGDGGGDVPAMDEYEDQQLRIAPITAAFDAKVDAIPVTESDRAAAEAFDAYREFIDADTARTIAAAQSGDQDRYDAALQPSAEFEAKLRPVETAGISCPAR
jgi:hypothetical protein